MGYKKRIGIGALTCGLRKFEIRLFTAVLLSVVLLLFPFQGCEKPGELQSGSLRDSAGVRWWKGNLHAHSLWSDGDHYPEMVVEWYEKHGYNFLALTDHNRLSQGLRWVDTQRRGTGAAALGEYVRRFGEGWVEQKPVDDRIHVRLKPLSEFRSLFEQPGRFLLIQSEEITDKKAHLNAINLLEAIPPQGGDTTVEVLNNNIGAVLAQRREKGQPMIVQINHPNFRWHLTAEDIARTEEVRFVELYNGIAKTNFKGDPNHCGVERTWDIVLTKRLAELNLPVVYATATDDAHHYHEFGPNKANPGRGWVVVRARRLTAESIIKAMESGDFYASTGVVLKDVTFDGKKLKVMVAPEKGCSYTTRFIGTVYGYEPTSRPVLDPNGAEIRATRIYTERLGEILAEVKGTSASYTIRGNEIYVRAKVTSTKLKQNPSFTGQFESAWVQPVVPAGM